MTADAEDAGVGSGWQNAVCVVEGDGDCLCVSGIGKLGDIDSIDQAQSSIPSRRSLSAGSNYCTRGSSARCRDVAVQSEARRQHLRHAGDVLRARIQVDRGMADGPIDPVEGVGNHRLCRAVQAFCVDDWRSPSRTSRRNLGIKSRRRIASRSGNIGGGYIDHPAARRIGCRAVLID